MHRRAFLSVLLTPSLSGLFRTRASTCSLGLIAYLQDGILWVRELPDNEPRRLIAGVQIHSPRFSPSGEWIAFHDGQAINVVNVNDLSVNRLTAGESVWLPDCDLLAVYNGEDLKFFSPKNGWSTPTLEYGETGRPVFSTDSAQFVYSHIHERTKGPAGEPISDGKLFRAFLSDFGRRPEILASRYMSILLPYAWTQDARSVLCWEDPDLSASLMADGLELVRVPVAGGSPKPMGVWTLLHDDMLALSPAQNVLALTVGTGRETWSGKRIGVINLNLLTLRYLTDENTSAICPSWSPDGNRIAHTAAPDAVSALRDSHNSDTPGVLHQEHKPQAERSGFSKRMGISSEQARALLEKRKIWSVEVSTKKPAKQLTRDDHYRDEEAMWSVEGTHILFCRMDRSGAGTLWLMDSDGKDSVQVSGRLALREDWFGNYGYIDWRQTFDWYCRGVSPRRAANRGYPTT